MVEVFKTDIESTLVAAELIHDLEYYFPSSEISFDLEDCDRILRIAAEVVPATEVISVVKRKGYNCEMLE